MVKRLIACVCLVFGALEAGAQTFPSQLWYLGEVTLTDNTNLTGRVKYDLEHDVVQLEREGRIETYSPQQVISFSFKVEQRRSRGKQDEVIERHFFSVPYTNDTGYKRPRFFEVVVEGKATLLAREYVTTVTNNANQRWGRNRRLGGINDPRLQGLPNTRRVLAHKMFLASLDGQIRELPNKRKDLLFLFRDHGNSMKAFIKQERLKVDQLYDMARFFMHYNSLGNQQTKAH